MLRIPDLKQPIEVESPFDFPLDPFQTYAIKAISNNENVLVTAKTGSGKTLVGEFQIHHSLKKGKRVFYTTPIKSLSNQKFHDLKKIFPSVGIMTGDIKFCPQADVVIMTTEILRNLLFKQGSETETVGVTANLSLTNLDAIVFDEVHYINDFDRGKVWEECLTLVPSEINLVLLSATIEKPEKFATWLGDIKQKPIHLISTEYRVVPLVHQLPNKAVVLDSKNVFNKKSYLEWFNKFYEDEKKHQQHKEKVVLKEPGQVIKQDNKSTSFVDRMNKLITYAIDLPALFFVFSRKVCVSLAKSVSSNLIDSSDSASVRHIVTFHLHKYKYLETSGQYHELLALLEKGVAYHHSGLLPVLKEIVEILFSKGLVKVLFATETFAVGINMPTKVVVFTSYRKYDEKTDRHRMLTTSEYTQMAGRAGRRGKDDKGIVVYLPMRDPEPVAFVEEMMTGKQSTVVSRMDFHYSFVLSELNSNKKIQQQTYWAFQKKEQVLELEKDIEREHEKLVEMDQHTIQELLVKETLETNFYKSSNAQKKKWQAEISKWNNSHAARTWDISFKTLTQNKLIKNKIEGLRETIKTISELDADILLRKNLLEQTGYLQNGGLTHKGLLASEIHEGHNLLMSHAFTEKLLHTKSEDDILVSLSVFLEDVQTDEPIEKIPFHETLKEIAQQIYYLEPEYLKSEYSYWTLTSYWAEVVWEWIHGNDFVCEQFGVDYGNFVRAMLKLSNILEEWMNLATISQDVEMLEKLKDSSKKILKGFVIPDSLYLRI